MSLRTITIVFALGTVTLILTAHSFLSAAPPEGSDAPNDKPLTQGEKEVIAAIEAYNKAIGQKNLEMCMDMFVPGEQTMLLGTGPGESWRGPEEIRDAHKHFLEGFDKEETEPAWRQINVHGDIAWIAAMSHHVSYVKGEKKNDFYMNISAVLQKKDGKWRIALLHISNLTGPEKQK